MGLSKLELLFVVVIGLIFFEGALGESIPPVPGDAGWAGSFVFGTNSSVRYAVIPQTLSKGEWKYLGTSFTVEFWVKPNAFAFDPDGKWNDAFTAWGETRFLPLISRHPGNGFTNQWAHFLVQLTRTRSGMALVVWSGCGCAVEPQIVNGRQADLFNCGYGYLLNSDNPKIVAQGRSPFYVPTETWTHVAFSFDGDSTEPGKTRMASLYINGQLLYTNEWADAGNVGASYNKTTCQDKPMQWFRDFGLMDQVRMAYLDNQDFNSGRVVNNVDPGFNVYGFNGSLDELRIWKGVRTAQQIADGYDIALNSKDIQEDALVGYFKFNQGPIGNISEGAMFEDSRHPPVDPLQGYVVSNDNSNFLFWSPTRGDKQLGLVLNTKLYVVANLPTTPRVIKTLFVLPGSSKEPVTPTPIPVLSTSFQPFNLSVQSFSSALTTALKNGNITLTIASTGANLTEGTVVTPTTQIEATFLCSDATCSNLAGSGVTSFPFRNYAINYQTVPQSSLLASVFFHVVPDCDGVYDACGVCNGDNRTCQCIVYHEFKTVRMSYILLSFMVDFLVDKVSTTSQILDETIDKVTTKLSNNTPLPTPGAQTDFLMRFYNGCLSPYCISISKFLSQISPNPSPSPLP